MKQKRKKLSEVIGEGIHSGLRKYCGSEESRKAWQAISDMPDSEWNKVCDYVAEEILKKCSGRND